MIVLDYNPNFLGGIDTIVYLFIGLFIAVLFRFAFKGEPLFERVKIWIFVKLFVVVLLFRVMIDPIIWSEHIFKDLVVPQSNNQLNIYENLFRLLNFVILVPLLEELVFRFFIMGKILMKNNWNEWIIITLSSLFFSLIHINIERINYNVLILMFLLGVLLSLTYIKYGFIYCVFVHVIYNLITWFIRLKKGDYYLIISKLDFDFRYWIIVTTGLLFFLLFNFKFMNRVRKTPPLTEVFKNDH